VTRPREYGSQDWPKAAEEYVTIHGTLEAMLAPPREGQRIPVALPNGMELLLGPGEHNDLQRAVIELFLPRFAPGAHVLCVGDTSNRRLFVAEDQLADLGFPLLAHESLPDVIALDPSNGWLFLIDAVHSTGPMSARRVLELERFTVDVRLPKVHVTAFADARSFRSWAADIAWETQVWVAESPDHMVHFNGHKFLGPYSSTT
jgi:hypothetical protein